MSELESQYVKRGYWVNLDQGPILGQTITTDTRTGAVVIALLAVLTSLGLTHLWHLFTFFYHQVRADGEPSDGLFRQQQALLRTLPSPSAMMADSLKLWYMWRGTSDRALKRSLLHPLVATLFIVGSLAVSIFSSYVVSSTNLEVLVSSPHCGSLDWNASSWESYYTAVMAAAESYGPDCYQKISPPSKCDIYHRPNVAFTIEKAACPFDASMCASDSVVLDSGLVDLNDAFGVNVVTKDRVRYLDSLDESILGRARLPNEQFIQYFYGGADAEDPNDYTWAYSLYSSNLTLTFQNNWDVQTEVGLGTWKALPELQQKDADISLRLTNSNAVRYRTPVNDPMFAAHRRVTWASTNGKVTNTTFYMSDFPGTVLGCSKQYQYCYPNSAANEHCTELMREPASIDNTVFPGANQVQLALLSLLRNAADTFDIAKSGRYKAQVELSNNYGIIASLPDDQWIQELQDWESITWAAHQIVFADYAIGPTVRDPLSKSYILPPNGDGENAICRTQKMRKPGGFVNINYFGLIFAVSVSCIIILTDLGLLRFLTFVRDLTKSSSPRLDRWIQDGVYQLQRRAYEAQGGSTWKNLSGEIPITVGSRALSDLLMEPSSKVTKPPETSMKEQAILKDKTERTEDVQHSQVRGQSLQVLDIPRHHDPTAKIGRRSSSSDKSGIDGLKRRGSTAIHLDRRDTPAANDAT